MLPDAFYVKKSIVFVLYLNFFGKHLRGPKKYKDDALHYCNRLFLCLNSKFDKLKKFHLLKKLPTFVQCSKFFLKYKTDVKDSKTKFMQERCLVPL